MQEELTMSGSELYLLDIFLAIPERQSESQSLVIKNSHRETGTIDFFTKLVWFKRYCVTSQNNSGAVFKTAFFWKKEI
jgi:hypothetical protein